MKLTVLGGFVVLGIGGFFLLATPVSSLEQPINFDHQLHVSRTDGPQLECSFCHENADKSRYATIPNVDTCMGCHQSVKTESPEIQKLASYAEKKEQPKWLRIYAVDRSADAFFSHKPHIRASINCEECHGQVSQMKTIRRELELTMSWCVDCHRQRNASVDCYTCHR